ncbi:murein hydrolase activator EnvC family protein [Anaerofustis stercorihominis]|uniref:murein hydrolase activator EnvC family protein n=1 Tax=Anaerofustis stercorihominis TaxID=214853 RepID=UPI00214B56E8|nr:peptidoglycan DD-metalloendopeptidase family protein [Anaerofustis stercorihominis]MCR2032096.1 peptidoglycan DD-metalloendopeptidase family protein [Anaerofustis stercorihominis]
MKKRILSLILVFICVFTLPLTQSTITAKTTKQKLKDVENKLDDKKDSLNNSQDKADDLSNQIESYDTKIEKLEKKIEEQETNKSKVEKSLEKAKKELREAKEERKKYQDLLKERMEVMYMYGDTGYLDLIFSSENFSDLISKVITVQELVSYDQNIVKELQTVEKKIQTKTDKIAKEKKELEDLISKLNSNKDDLDTLKIAKNAQLANVKGDIKDLKKEVEKLEAEQNELSNKLASQSGSTTNKVYNTGNGSLGWPTPGNYYVTSEQGYRYHPISGVYKYHAGMDIGLSYGDSVVAPANGRVTIAGWYGGYGYAVGIDAGLIKGKHVTILLGHNSSVRVSVGQKVRRGQTVAYGGSTGYSTGPHCHFEVHADGVTQNPRNWL